MSVKGTSRRREHGSAVIVVLLLLAIVVVFIMANVRTLHYVGRDLRLIERQQVRRLAAGHPAAGKAATGGERKGQGAAEDGTAGK